MQLLEKVRETIVKHSMLSQGDNVLAGLSGGADSVCLLKILHSLKPEFALDLYAAYIDHGLRQSETPKEIDFCRELCKNLGISFYTKAIDVKSCAKEKGMSRQEAARELRYAALDELASGIKAAKIALGHNADDQAETVLMRLFTGSGPSGMSGIPPVRNHIIRPLIESERAVIEEFLKNEGLTYITDSSNLKNNYLRNRIRNTVMPAVKSLGINAVRSISRTSGIFRDEERYFDILTTKTLMRLISRKKDLSIELFLAPMETVDTAILRRLLRRAVAETKGLRGIGMTHIESIIGLIKTGKPGDRVCIQKNLRAIKGYSTLIITSEKPAVLGAYSINCPGETVLKESSLVISCSLEDKDPDASCYYGNGKRSAAIDADKVRLPLLIRSRMPGDFFYPMGFGRRKKLQDYFVDEKIPRDMRDSIPLLISDNDIVWVIGHRMDDRHRIDKKTERVLKFEVKPLKI